ACRPTDEARASVEGGHAHGCRQSGGGVALRSRRPRGAAGDRAPSALDRAWRVRAADVRAAREWHLVSVPVGRWWKALRDGFRTRPPPRDPGVSPWLPLRPELCPARLPAQRPRYLRRGESPQRAVLRV